MTAVIAPEQIFIFSGPTLSPAIATEKLDAIYLPPVKMGDIYRICELFSPRIIGIIDGYFNQVPAVWHKEILYALSRGIQVFGAASMGALRAAEMDQFGMIGCGEIYRAYQRGVAPFSDETFENDDEVAVIHGPAELNYLAASDALINMRFTLAAAVQNGIIDQHVGKQLIEIASHLFYAQRRYAKVLEIARQRKLNIEQLNALTHWLQDNKIDQKRRDALSLLAIIKDVDSLAEISETDHLSFEHTSQWRAAIDEIDQSHFVPHPAVNELRLEGENYFNTLNQVATKTEPLDISPPDPKPLNQWHASPEQLNVHLSELWCTASGHRVSEPATRAQTERLIVDVLEQSGTLSALDNRAKSKQAMLARMKPKVRNDGLSEFDQLQLCDWYFSTRLNTRMPDYPHEYAAQLGFANEHDFYAMLLTEYLYIESRQEIPKEQ